MILYRGERQYLHLPFWGLEGVTPQVQLTSLTQISAAEEGGWQNLTAQPTYTPPGSWTPPPGVTGDPEWWGLLLAGPDVSGNPGGTVVITEISRIRTRITAGDEIDIQPAIDEWVHLTA